MLNRIAAGRTDLIVEWADKGEDPTAKVDGVSLIGWCAYYGDVSAIRYLCERGVRLEDLGSDLGLNGAAFHGHWRLCEFLIEQGANPRSANAENGETPLHAALCSEKSIEHERVVEVLLAAGADPNAATIPGMETGSFMRDVRTRGESPLHRAAANGTLDSIRLLIGAGAERAARDVNGDSPLTWASLALRETSVMQALCFPPFAINSDRESMRSYLVGGPKKE
ncbi:ankyrin repeat domain-containing protein [Parerythrobacter aurantius]|uniref:ankyrin repeat domain-containing protein n=1 Tax=Parerythrobacter aurantius TaxID=3127706 RepID=UPI0032553D3B